MITIPLAPVAAFLCRHDALAALEGAPWDVQPIRSSCQLLALRALDLEVETRHPEAVLYLGSGDICPAALGWAARVLALARGQPGLNYAIEDWWADVKLWSLGNDEPTFHWSWDPHATTVSGWSEACYLPGPAPTTPAERLRAVLLHELGSGP